MASGGGISLEEAIKSKYGGGSAEQDAGAVRESAVYLRPRAHAVGLLTNIVLEKHGVSHVTSEAELADLCPQVKELHLASNSLSQWHDLLTALLKLTFLDLSQNCLLSMTFISSPPSSLSTSLHALVLSSTSISWPAVQTCLMACPGLQELHLNNNGYSTVTLDPSFSHSSLQRLHINNNHISQWAELERVGHAFPSLHTLVAISNPLKEVRQEEGQAFPSLQSLTLSSTQVSDWTSIESLASLSNLSDLRMYSVPLGQEMGGQERRLSVIARMPALHRLNKSEISYTERENAERWLIRLYRDSPERPKIYQTLVDIHGLLQPLCDLDLSSGRRVSLQFLIDHEDWKRTEIENVDMCQTTGQLRQIWSQRLNVAVSKLRFFYVDMEVEEEAPHEITRNTRRLFVFKMKDGDRIHIQLL